MNRSQSFLANFRKVLYICSMKTNQIRNLLVVLGVLLLISLRFVAIDIPNFAPIAAAGIFSAFYFKQKLWAFVVPLFALFISDILLSGFSLGRVIDYAAFAAGITFAIILFSKSRSFLAIIGATTVGSLLFFFVSNFGVWLAGGLYPPTLGGLIDCYMMGIPFYKNTLFGDLFFVASFFLFYEWLLSSITNVSLQINR